MLKGICTSLGSNFINRVSNPFLGTFTLVLFLRNWEIFYSLFVFDEDSNRTCRIGVLKSYIGSAYDVSFNFIYTALWTFAILTAMYIFLAIGELISNFYDSSVKPLCINLATKGQKIVLKEKYDELFNQLNSSNEILPQERGRRRSAEDARDVAEKENVELKVNLIELNKEIEEYKNKTSGIIDILFNQVQNEKDLKKKVNLATKLIEIDSNFIGVHNARGNAKYDLGDKEGAILDYDEAIRLNPKDSEIYFNRGMVKYELGDTAGAISDYSEAIRLNPNNSEAHNNRGNAKSDLGDKEGAILDYNEAIRLNPAYSEAHDNKGIVKSDLGDDKGAILAFNEAIKLNPAYSNAYNNRGNAKSDSGDDKGAILDYDEAIRLNPKDCYPYSNRAKSYYELGEYNVALDDANKSIEMGSNLLNTYKIRSLIYRALAEKEADEAKKAEYIKRAEADEKKAKDLEDSENNT